MSHHLVVSKAFGKYRAGQTVTDPAEIESISGSTKAGNFVRVFAPAAAAAPAPAAAPDSAPHAEPAPTV